MSVILRQCTNTGNRTKIMFLLRDVTTDVRIKRNCMPCSNQAVIRLKRFFRSGKKPHLEVILARLRRNFTFFADNFVDWQPTFSKLCWCLYWSTSGAAWKVDHRMLIFLPGACIHFPSRVFFSTGWKRWHTDVRAPVSIHWAVKAPYPDWFLYPNWVFPKFLFSPLSKIFDFLNQWCDSLSLHGQWVLTYWALWGVLSSKLMFACWLFPLKTYVC